MDNKRLYRIWSAMKSRCSNPNLEASKYYYHKGIRVCEEWKKYSNFEKWALANGYKDNLSIDRLNNDGNYEPSNCRWITKEENSRKATKEKTGIWGVYEQIPFIKGVYDMRIDTFKEIVTGLSYSEALKQQHILEEEDRKRYDRRWYRILNILGESRKLK